MIVILIGSLCHLPTIVIIGYIVISLLKAFSKGSGEVYETREHCESKFFITRPLLFIPHVKGVGHVLHSTVQPIHLREVT